MLNRKYLTILLLCISTSSANVKETSQRDKRILSLFTVVTFPNQQCTASSSTSSEPVYGTCFSSTECTNKGGSADGNCAAGFGQCCTFTVSTCGSSVSNNCTYIQNPSYPTTYATTGSCEYSVLPLNSDICQLRLDFDNFAIAAGTTAGACVDSFDVTVGSSRFYHTICGTNTGQHIYLETGRETSGQTLKFTIATGGTWRMKVNQIECWSTAKADSDCYQYLTGVHGEIKSFNYGAMMLDNTAYGICVRKEVGYCGIQWAQADTTSPDTFDLDAADTAALTAEMATMDNVYISIPGSLKNEYGGFVLSNANTDTTGAAIPASHSRFLLFVNTYGAQTAMVATNADANLPIVGFHLTYTQLPCVASP